MDMSSRYSSALFTLSLLFGACPKRQTTPRIVYAPSPPPDSSPAPGSVSETMTIEPPPAPAPAPEAAPAPDLSNPKPPTKPRRVVRGEPGETADAAPEPEQPPTPRPAGLPALEPRESHEEESALRGQIQGLQKDVQGRIAATERRKLTRADAKTLDDARTFIAQSRKALVEGDLQRALNLARKASLLIQVLEL